MLPPQTAQLWAGFFPMFFLPCTLDWVAKCGVVCLPGFGLVFPGRRGP